jgi:hypothetical protein
VTGPTDRLPPGQALAAKWPVLTFGPAPVVDTGRWTFRIFGETMESARERRAREP